MIYIRDAQPLGNKDVRILTYRAEKVENKRRDNTARSKDTESLFPRAPRH